MPEFNIYYTIGDILRDVFIPDDESLAGKTVPIGDVLNLVYDKNSHALRVNVSGLDALLSNISGLGDLSNTIFVLSVSDGGPFDNSTVVEKGYTISQLTFEMNTSPLTTHPYFGFANLTMDGNPITLDSNDNTLTSDTYSNSITENDIGSGFSMDVLYGASGEYSDTKVSNINFGLKAYYGYDNKSTLTESDITSLDDSSLETGLEDNVNVTYGTNSAQRYLWFCYPTGWNDLKNITSGGNTITSLSDWVNAAIISVTNAYGYTTDYNCYRTIYKNSSSDLPITFN